MKLTASSLRGSRLAKRIFGGGRDAATASPASSSGDLIGEDLTEGSFSAEVHDQSATRGAPSRIDCQDERAFSLDAYDRSVTRVDPIDWQEDPR